MIVEIDKETERLLREQLDSGHFKLVAEGMAFAFRFQAKTTACKASFTETIRPPSCRPIGSNAWRRFPRQWPPVTLRAVHPRRTYGPWAKTIDRHAAP